MTNIAEWLDRILTDSLHMDPAIARSANSIILIALMIITAIGVNWVLQSAFLWLSRHNLKLLESRWHKYLVMRRLGHHAILLIPGLLLYAMPYIVFDKEDEIIRMIHRLDLVYMIIVMIMIGNAILLAFLDFYSTTDKNRSHPLQGLIQGLQVIMCFVGGIMIIAILIDKSPVVLLTGLGASAAVLMLIFKDSILGFVAGVQLSQNKMLLLGDWIQMPDGSANGTVEEITLNTVKVRNWDNTLSMIPPYTLVTTPFKNWRGMQESGGRRADKCIYIDMTSLESCSPEMVSDICKSVPLMESYIKALPKETMLNCQMTNIQLFRIYIELYLRSHPDVNQSLDLIVTQKEATPYGLPIEVYFFIKDKAWAVFEKKQSDIFSHLMTMPAEFRLHLYQRP